MKGTGRALLALGVALAALLTGGCRNGIELNDLAIVTMAGFDLTESGAVKLSVSVVIPGRVSAPGTSGSGKSPEKPPLTVVSATGSSMAEAVSHLQYRIPRHLFFGHTKVLVFGEGFARQGVLLWIDFWSRHMRPRLTSYVITVPGEAQSFLLAEPDLRRLPSDAVREHLESQLGLPSTIRDFMAALTERSRSGSPITPRMELLPVESHGGKESPGIGHTGAALYRGDRLVGWLNQEEMRHVTWLRERPHLGLITAGPEGGRISADIAKAQSNLTVTALQGQIVTTVKAQVALEVVDSQVDVDLMDPQQALRVEQLFERALTERLKKTYDHLVREQQVDPLNVADKLYRSSPQTWRQVEKRWPALLAKSKLQVDLTVKIRRSGKHGPPLSRPSEE